MSPLEYSSRPRFGRGWLGALVRLGVAATLVITIASAVRVVQALRGPDQERGPRSTEERLLEDALEAVRQDPANVKARWQLSLALSTVGSHEQARTEAEEAVKLDKESVEAFYALGVAYRGLGDVTRAEKALVKATSLPGSFSDTYREAYFELGEVRTELDKHEEAAAAYESALANGPEATYVVVALADALVRAGNVERAKEEYLAVMGYDPANEQVERALRDLGVSAEEIDQARDPVAHRPAGEVDAGKDPS